MAKISNFFNWYMSEELKQKGTSNRVRDGPRKALIPGKRVSKSGKIYYETRKNRSDKIGSSL